MFSEHSWNDSEKLVWRTSENGPKVSIMQQLVSVRWQALVSSFCRHIMEVTLCGSYMRRVVAKGTTVDET